MEPDPPAGDPCKFGWTRDEQAKALNLLMLPTGTKYAPDAVLKSTRCNCKASQCKTNACSCAKAKMGCSEFCGCGDEGYTNECNNKWNENQYESDDEDENEDEFEDEDEDNED
ncbi:uncharacterized protein [Clytia hemisphaerica]